MAKDSPKGKIREAAVAGIFYPEEREELEREVNRLVTEQTACLASAGALGAHAIISPHAGLGYSGDLAALAWGSVSPRSIERVVVLAPLHRAEESLVYLPESECFSTPLGPVEVDMRAVSDILDCGTAFVVNDIPHLEEHGVEMQLPFMRLLYPGARLVPILVGKASPALVKSLASALSLVFADARATTLFVISTDLAAGHDALAIAQRTDELLAFLKDGDWKAILDFGGPAEELACGAACLASWLSSRLSSNTAAVILGHHDSSATRQSDQERLVHYAAVAFVGKEAPQ
jgi:hypothetical protein